MPGQGDNVDTSGEHVGAGVEEIEVIETDEELEAFLTNQNADEQSSEGDGDGAGDEGDQGGAGTGDGTGAAGDEGGDEGGAAGDSAGDGKGTGDNKDGGINIGSDLNKDNKGPAGDNTFDSAVHYLDDRFGLKMNLAELPKEMDAATEAKAVGDIFSRLQTGLSAKLGEYEDVRTVLEDKEVKDFIAAKAEGKTLKDYAIQYANTTEGLSNEQLVREELKLITPNASDDDISTVVEGYKSSETLDKTADIMRTARKDRETQEATDAEQLTKDNLKAQSEKRTQDIAEFGGYLKKVNSVYGVPVTEDMRNQVFIASTQQDENGDTYLDKALQSDQGILLATLGLLHMERLVQASASTKNNRANKSLADKLFATPEQLQSGEGEGSGDKLNEQDELAAINQI
jgi:hypothetical protein